MARSFNGGTDVANAGVVSAINSNPVTLAGWAKATAFTNDYGSPFNNYNDSTTNQVGVGLFIRTTGKLAFYISGSQIYDGTGTNTLSAGTWYHLAVTAPTSGSATGYVNGASDNTGTVAAQTGTPVVRIGLSTNGGAAFNGSVADFGAWNVVLTVAEIKALANGARPYTVRPGSLRGYWPLDGLQSPEPDLSGGAHNGTLTGTASAFGPPIMQLTPRMPLNLAAVAIAGGASFQAAWAMRNRIVVEGIGI